MEAQLKIPEVKAFDHDVLLLIVPDSAHMQYTPIMLGTLHIDMAIKLATKKELKNLNKQWQRSPIATRLSMKGAQVMNVEETQIVAQLDSSVKLARDIIVRPFETVETKGILWKTPNYYKRMNVGVGDLQGKGSSKDIVVISQLQILKAGSDKILIALRNLTSRTLKLKKGMNVAHVEASQVIPPLEEPIEERKVCGNSQGKVPTEEKNERILEILQQLDLTGIKTWTEQQQNVVKELLEEYQHLFALNLKELGKTSLV